MSNTSQAELTPTTNDANANASARLSHFRFSFLRERQSSFDMILHRHRRGATRLRTQCHYRRDLNHMDEVRRSRPSWSISFLNHIVLPFLCSTSMIVLLADVPAVSHGTPLLLLPVGSEESILPQQLSQSANAARLLLDTPGATPSTTAIRQLTKQKELQDRRLEQCHESGKYWEQCFYYGTAPKSPEPLWTAPATGATSNIPTTW
jgi:hypothetical protein